MLDAGAGTGVRAGFEQVPLALAALQDRVLAVADTLEAGDWCRQSRCELWTVHDVLRHVRDGCRLHVGRLRSGAEEVLDEQFDARRTPQLWLDRSAGEAPADTVDQLRVLGAEEGAALAARMREEDREETVVGPYGRVHWSTFTLHIVWDRWLHVRDVTQALRRSSPSSPVEHQVVAVYALLVASMPAVLRRHHFQARVALTTEGGRTYHATVEPGRAWLRSGAPEDAADLHGALEPVVDSLAGRGPGLESVVHGDPAIREPLTWLRPILAPERAGEE